MVLVLVAVVVQACCAARRVYLAAGGGASKKPCSCNFLRRVLRLMPSHCADLLWFLPSLLHNEVKQWRLDNAQEHVVHIAGGLALQVVKVVL